MQPSERPRGRSHVQSRRCSAIRSAAVPPNGSVECTPTLHDLFKGQASEGYSPGEAIFWEGDQAGHIFDVLEGVLRVYKILPDGRRAVMGFIHAGEMLGVSFRAAICSRQRRSTR